MTTTHNLSQTSIQVFKHLTPEQQIEFLNDIISLLEPSSNNKTYYMKHINEESS